MTEQELMAYTLDPSHNLCKQVENGATVLEACYRPAELLIAQELRTTKKEYSELKGAYDSMDYFILSISRSGREIESYYTNDSRRYESMVTYLSDEITGDLYLTTNSDTLWPAGVIYNNTFGRGVKTTVMVAFKSNLKGAPGTCRLFFNDHYFIPDLHQFEFENSSIKKIPTLSLTK